MQKTEKSSSSFRDDAVSMANRMAGPHDEGGFELAVRRVEAVREVQKNAALYSFLKRRYLR